MELKITRQKTSKINLEDVTTGLFLIEDRYTEETVVCIKINAPECDCDTKCECAEFNVYNFSYNCLSLYSDDTQVQPVEGELIVKG